MASSRKDTRKLCLGEEKKPLSDRVRTLLIADNEPLKEKVENWCPTLDNLEYLGFVPATPKTLQALQLYLPDLLLVGMTNWQESLQVISRLSLAYPHGAYVVVTPNPNASAIREMMRAGVLDYLDVNADMNQAAVSLLQTYRASRKRYERLSVQVLSERSVRPAKSIVFLGNTGGVGKSTLATSIAAVFAQRGAKTVLLDLNLRSGVDPIYLGLSPDRTLADLAAEVTDLDATVLNRYLLHHSTGLDVLCAPRTAAGAASITPALVKILLQALLRQYEYVVIDTPPLLDDIVLTAVDASQDFLLVSTMNVSALHNARRLMDLWNKLGYSETDLKHIINRSGTKSGLRISDVHRILKSSVFWQVGNDEKAMNRAINDGELLVLKHPNHRISRELNRLADSLFERYRYRPTRRSRSKGSGFNLPFGKKSAQG
ncbi:hypothetical protein D2Q93_09005 [Alicyclobacillaceae bacterium I2511]|nr:hypothetical protein D2Q93_09005 [Alicyclobacillaceae bacterium I2511]